MTYLSIGWRLTLWYGIAIAILLCGFYVLLLLLMRHQVVTRTDAGLKEEVKEIGQEINLSADATAFQDAAEARFTQHAFYEFLVTTTEGGVVFTSSNLNHSEGFINEITQTKLALSMECLTRRLGDSGSFRIAQKSIPSRFGTLRVYVLRSLTPLMEDVLALQRLMAGLLPVGMLLALGIGHFLARQALAPIQKVLDVANSIDITCLDQRITVINPHDEIGQLASSLNSFIGRLEHAVTEIRRFTADASHEIRTPLAALRAEAEAALRSPRTPSEYVAALQVVADEAGRLGRLADQLLQLSRHDAGVMNSTHEFVQLDALLHDVTDQLRGQAESRGVNLQCRCTGSCEVMGDDIRLSQVFFNVVDNAIKYTHDGGQVDVRMKAYDHEALIEIQDSGIGISPDDLPHIFDRFYRADPSRHAETGGAGLGLSIAKAAIVAHQGVIDARSTLGKGTVVIIRLPATRTTSAPIATLV
ncbi:sensor histidine kinase [Lacunimicrobium album]